MRVLRSNTPPSWLRHLNTTVLSVTGLADTVQMIMAATGHLNMRCKRLMTAIDPLRAHHELQVEAAGSLQLLTSIMALLDLCVPVLMSNL